VPDTPLDIKILYQENCPNYTKACTVICDVIAKYELDTTINIIKIEPNSDYASVFRGSPTVLINDRDVELCFNGDNELTNKQDMLDVIACRIYDCDVGIGCPSHEMIDCSIQENL
jgi:hypothetical protein